MGRTRRGILGILSLLAACGGGGLGAPPPVALADVSFLWSGTGTGEDYIRAVDGYDDGSTVVTGNVNGSLTLEDGSSLYELDETDGTLLLARMNADGSLAWARTDGNRSGVAGLGVAALADGSCLVTGIFSGTVTFGRGEPTETTFTSAGGTDLFLNRYSATGELLWARQAGGSTVGDARLRLTGDLVEELAAFADGSCVLAGEYSISTAFGSGADRVVVPGVNGYGTFLARYNADGSVHWARGLTWTSGPYTKVAARADGSCLVIGLTPADTPPPFPSSGGTTLKIGNVTLRRAGMAWSRRLCPGIS